LKLIPALIIGRSLDILVQEGYGRIFLRSIFLIFVLALANYIMRFLGNYIYAIASLAYERDIRQEYIEVIQSHPLQFHDQHNSSRLLALGMNEIRWIQHGIMPGMTMVLRSFLSVIFVMVYLYNLVDLSILLIVFFGFIGYFFLGYRYAAKVGPIRTEVSEQLSLLTERSQETFKGIGMIRSFGSSEREIRKFQQQSTVFAKLQRLEIRQSAFFLPGLVFLVITAMVFALTLVDVQAGVLSVGEFVQIISLLITLQALNIQLPRHLLNLRAALVNADRLWGKMDPIRTSETAPSARLSTVVDWATPLEFDRVSFSYTDDHAQTLQNISFSIPYGSTVAIVGGPGSGKSSLFKLLLNLYQPQQGEIRIGGVSYADIKGSQIREHVAMVEQEVFLFSGTVRDNLAFSRPDVSEQEMIVIAKATQAWEFIRKLPKGLDTTIGERGVTLSGGQRQRLAIARALLADPSILLLDDSSSALDSNTDLRLRKALETLNRDRTTIMVTQRLASLKEADQIIVLVDGSIEAIGTHEGLLQTNERYTNMFSYLPEHEHLLGGTL
jgi:ATP-binding cassette subfamily B protein